MSLASSVIQMSADYAAAVPLPQLVRAFSSASALAGFAVVFRPLLTGIGRALALAVRQRLGREELAARRQRYESATLQRGISATAGAANGPTPR
jgi:hypothetical protein